MRLHRPGFEGGADHAEPWQDAATVAFGINIPSAICAGPDRSSREVDSLAASDFHVESRTEKQETENWKLDSRSAMSIVPRARWSVRPPKAPPHGVRISARTATCVHHDGAFAIHVRSRAEAVALVRADQSFHMDARGWNDIGYNYLVISAPGIAAIDGLVFEGRGRDVVGAHCKGHNTEWIGVQVATGGDQRPSAKALASVRRLHDSFETAAGHALAKVGHRDGFPTECPGEALYAWVRAGMPVGTRAQLPTRRSPARPPSRTRPRVRPASTRARLVVDGRFGPATIKALQRWARVRADGVLGPASWRAIQRKVGAPVDGKPGRRTWAAIQRRIGVPADGSPGRVTYAALQRYLNLH